MEKLAIVNLTIGETASTCLHHTRNNIQYGYGVYFGVPNKFAKVMPTTQHSHWFMQ
jgi:hypothetical protein